ncbi:MAG: hypothetical protein ACOH2H_09570 [Cypionkella sp.]
MTPEDIAAHFTRPDGTYAFARWGRPIVPVVFGVDDATLAIFKGAIEAVVTLADHKMAAKDPELGANLMIFCLRDWAELPAVPGLDRLVPELEALCNRLSATQANQYRLFRFDAQGAIRATFLFLRMDAALAAVPAEDLALAQMVRMICLWSDQAFATQSPLAKMGDRVILRPEIAALIRVGYDRILPACSQDPSHALRLFARMNSQQA